MHKKGWKKCRPSTIYWKQRVQNLIKGKSRDEDINREAESESNKRRR